MKDAKFIDVRGIQTRYFEAGTGDPLVLVHGGQFGSYSCATDWDLNFNGLACNYHVFALDKIGQGHTDNPHSTSEYVLGTAVQHVYDFMQAIGLEEAHLVGHSRGGYAVAQIAIDHTEIVKSLTIVDSGSLMHESSPFYAELERKAAQITNIRERYQFKMISASFAGTSVSDGWLDDVMSFVTTSKYAEARVRCFEMEDTLQEDHIARQREAQESIKSGALKDLPVLLIWAYNDSSATIEECGIPAMHLIMCGVPNSRMHIFNQADHYSFREHPAEFNAVVQTFISAI